MRVDLGNAIDGPQPGLDRDALDALDDRVAAAHERIATGMADGEDGYDALNLPARTDPGTLRDRLQAGLPAGLHGDGPVLVAGIGGSALGTTTVTRVLETDRPVHVLDNVDPTHLRATLADVLLDEALLIAVSRSGTTTETLATTLAVRDAMADTGVDWTDRTAVVTGDAGPLRRLADRHDCLAFDAPERVPGRFGVLSTMGGVPAAAAGCELQPLLDGAASVVDGLNPSLYETPAYAYGAAAHALGERDATVNAIMPYAEALEPFAEWVAQLWAESLGKEGRGQLPLRALGTTDQHALLQRFLEGPRDSLVTVVTADTRPAYRIAVPDHPDIAHLDGDLTNVIAAERRATEAALADAGRPSVRVTVDAVDACGLGELLAGFQAACICAGELADVATFTQPGVEWGKRAAQDLLDDDTPGSRFLEDEERFVVD